MDKHIILTNGRSGSNYISGLLNLHPQLTNYGEVLGEWTLPYMIYDKFFKSRISTESYLDYIYNSKLFFNVAQIYSAYSKINKKEKLNFKTYNQITSLGIKEFSINFFKRNIENYLASKKSIFVINLFIQRKLSIKINIFTGDAKYGNCIDSQKTRIHKNLFESRFNFRKNKYIRKRKK